MKTNIPTDSIMSILTAVVSDTFPYLQEPDIATKPGEIERGIVNSVPARRIFTAIELLIEQIADQQEVVQEYRRLFANDHGMKERYEETVHAVRRLEHRRNVLAKLMWQAIKEEHPACLNTDASIRTGWKLVTPEGGDWKELKDEDRTVGLASTTASNIMEIFQGKVFEGPTQVNSDPVAADEKVIGEVDDVRIRSLGHLFVALNKETNERIMPPGTNPDKPELDRDAVLAWVESHTLASIRKMRRDGHMAIAAMELVEDVFWSCVSDSIPSPKRRSLGIREGWKVVETPPEERSLDIENSCGIAIPVPADSELGRLIQTMVRDTN